MISTARQTEQVDNAVRTVHGKGRFVEFRESDNDRARELFGQALPLYQQI
jgi:hypothetical protein